MNITEHVRGLMQAALDECKSRGILSNDFNTQVKLDRPAQAEHGDFATNIALVAAKAAGAKPRDLAESILSTLPASEWVTKAEIAGPGFINFYISDKWLHATVASIAELKERFGTSGTGRGISVQIEFVSANPTGPLHVGSGRNAAYGDSLSRLLEATGHKVHREFYVNDAGNQMQRFGQSLRARYLQALGQEVEVPPDGYAGEYLAELGRVLRKEARDSLVEAELQRFIDWGVEQILEIHRATLDRFGVRFDHWFSEQQLHESGKVAEAIERLSEAGFVYEKEGAMWFKATELGAPRDQVLVRSDESRSPTYLAVDVAYLMDKVARGFNKAIYIWGADHHGNVAGLKAAATALDLQDSVEFLLHQMVNLVVEGEVARMSKRAGTLVTLDELMNEVGADVARYNFLSRTIDVTIDFDMALAKLESPENPAYYVQYQHARACSVLAQGAASKDASPDLDLSLLVHPSEKALMRKLGEFEEMVADAAASRTPHRVAHYTYALATAFSGFYRDCKVLTDDAALSCARLELVDAFRQVIANGLSLLGISAPDHM